jgi:hypothetical protein
MSDRSSIPEWAKAAAVKINNHYELGLSDVELRNMAWVIYRTSLRTAPPKGRGP